MGPALFLPALGLWSTPRGAEFGHLLLPALLKFWRRLGLPDLSTQQVVATQVWASLQSDQNQGASAKCLTAYGTGLT